MGMRGPKGKHRKSAKPDDPKQMKRFIETAEQVGADDGEAFERAFKKIAPAQKQPRPRKD